LYDILSAFISCQCYPELPQAGKEFKASLMDSVAMVLQTSPPSLLCQLQSLQSRIIEVKKDLCPDFQKVPKVAVPGDLCMSK